jgi:hypothetical protein
MELPTPKKVGISMGSLGPKDLPMLFFSTSRFVYLEEFMGKAMGNPVIYIYIYCDKTLQIFGIQLCISFITCGHVFG